MEKLYRLADSTPVAIMSGATFARLERDVMNHMPAHLRIPFYVFSDNGSRADEWIDGHWIKKYGMPLGDDEREFLRTTITEAVGELDLFENEADFRIVDRGTSVSFVALAQEASKAEKEAWDPEFVKRPKLAQLLREKAPAYDVLIAGRTTIDIVRKGISKAYGVEWFSNELKIPAKEMLFIGDAFYEGGNDASVIPTGIKTYATSGPEETEKLIDKLLG
jgi:phosphomannomutase